MAEPDLVAAVPKEHRKPIRWWRVILGSLIALISLAELGLIPQNLDGAIIILILSGSMLCSGLPIRQPRWWLATPGFVLLYIFLAGAIRYGTTLETMGRVIAVILGGSGFLLCFYGLSPNPRENSK